MSAVVVEQHQAAVRQSQEKIRIVSGFDEVEFFKIESYDQHIYYYAEGVDQRLRQALLITTPKVWIDKLVNYYAEGVSRSYDKHC